MPTAAKGSQGHGGAVTAGIITAHSGTARRYAVVNGDRRRFRIEAWPLAGAIRMVLAGIYERRNRRRAYADGHSDGRAEGRLEGRAEGRAEANSAWRDWLRRKEAAAERGEPCHEPMPDDESAANAGAGGGIAAPTTPPSTAAATPR